jgi:anti-sigma B factor antagonist
MQLKLSSQDGCTIAASSGPLDETAREPFREHLHPLVGNKGARLVLDLAGSQRVNSAGIGNLVALTADANTNDSRVVLCNLQPYVETVISITKLDRFFLIAADVAAAIARCRAEDK